MADRLPANARRLVEVRSGGICEGCGNRPATDIHHRKYRSRGGTHNLDNLLHLCGGASGLPGGNHSGCHGIAHSLKGHDLGWSVHSWDDPGDVPAEYRGRPAWLTLWGSATDTKQVS